MRRYAGQETQALMMRCFAQGKIAKAMANAPATCVKLTAAMKMGALISAHSATAMETANLAWKIFFCKLLIVCCGKGCHGIVRRGLQLFLPTAQSTSEQILSHCNRRRALQRSRSRSRSRSPSHRSTRSHQGSVQLTSSPFNTKVEDESKPTVSVLGSYGLPLD